MKVLLLDDHPLVLTAVRNVIHALDPATVVCTADNPVQALALLAEQTDVDLVLLDLGLGAAVDGFAVLAHLREHHPGLPVVVLSAIDRLTDMVRAIDLGAMGFVPKSSPTGGLSDALALVLGGGVFIPPALLGLIQQGGNLAEAAAAADAASSHQAALAQARQRAALAAGLPFTAEAAALAPAGDAAALAPAGDAGVPAPAGDAAAPATAHSGAGPRAADPPDAVLQPMTGARAPATATVPVALPAPALSPKVSPLPASGPLAATRAGLAGLGLTPRQCEVLLLLLRGLPNKLIARELGLSVDTVKDHVAAVLRTLGVATRTQAVLMVSRLTQQGQQAAGPAALLAVARP